MKKETVCFVLVFCIVLYPCRTGITQQSSMVVPQKINIIKAVEKKQQQLFDIAFSNQDTVKDLISKKKPKTIVVEKIKYIKVYKTVPIYLPELELNNYESEDTLERDYMVVPHINLIPNLKKKRRFLGVF